MCVGLWHAAWPDDAGRLRLSLLVAALFPDAIDHTSMTHASAGYLSVWQPPYRIRQLPSCDLAQPLSTVAWSSPGPRRLLIEAARVGAHT